MPHMNMQQKKRGSQSSWYPTRPSCSTLPMLNDLKVNMHIYGQVYTPANLYPTINNLVVVRVLNNKGAFTVKAVSAYTFM